MKTDADIKRDVEAELAWDPAIKASGIACGCRPTRQGLDHAAGDLG